VVAKIANIATAFVMSPDPKQSAMIAAIEMRTVATEMTRKKSLVQKTPNVVKYIPLLLLANSVTVVGVAAPRQVREGLVSHDAAGKSYVISSHPAVAGGPFITARLRVNYVIAGLPGEIYSVELWLGRTGDDRLERYHFDTQEIAVPGEKGGKLKEVTGRFNRSYHDRDSKRSDKRQRFVAKPGNYNLLPIGRSKSWDCRLVIKKDGKVISDTGYFQAELDPVIEI